ncbi:MAG: hypothetical protein B7X95_01405 [Methylophilaceae bacterium 17-44-8]|nr:MAG: hypothetical protein B7X95_01405 [Methylophilaceae bacterium 17-44-8]
MLNPLSLIGGLSWQTKLIAISALCLASFVGGWRVHGWKTDAAQGVSIAKQEKTRDTLDVESDKKVLETQKQEVETKIVYRTIREKINDKDDKRVCFADSDALSLWNEAIAGASAHRSALPAETTINDPFITTVEEVLTNAANNFQICNENAIKHNALIDKVESIKQHLCVCAE